MFVFEACAVVCTLMLIAITGAFIHAVQFWLAREREGTTEK